ncbi:MAG: hypothetical protein E6Q62_04800 [Nitrosomonas sp.]|nr:MAG: hypothetical protein E6Q62_04800 [Nitrosomonas sp.]
MNQPPPQSSDKPGSSKKEKPEVGIGAIVGLSLFLGLMAGAAVDKSHILPVTLICAIILYCNRHKIATQDTSVHAKRCTIPTQHYAWPELNQFPVTISAVPYQSAIQQLAQENPIDPKESNATSKRFFQALLVPVNDNPYDDNVIRVDIGDRTVGYLSYDQARSFRRKLDNHHLDNQITTCTAALIEHDETQPGQTVRYGIKLGIELPD